MKKLFLSSSFFLVGDYLKKILPADSKTLTVVFVPTAADNSTNPWYVKEDRQKLESMGFKILDLSLKDKISKEVKKILDQADIIFVAGGNCFYLFQQARASGFVKLVPDLVAKGVIYVGSSAGSYLACPTIEVAAWKNQDVNRVGLKDLTGLSLVPFLISAHYDPQYRESLKVGIAQTKYPVKILSDQQTLLVEDDRVELVGEGEEVKI